METLNIVTLARVRNIAENYCLGAPYDNPEQLIQNCFVSVIGDYRLTLTDHPEHACKTFCASDETLEQIIDEYFNL